VRHSRRPTCGPSATYRAEVHEEQLARLFDDVRLSEADVDQVLAAMRTAEPAAPPTGPKDVDAARAELQRQLAVGELTLDTFSRAWRRLNRPVLPAVAPPDELRLRRARKRLTDFGTLWRNPAVPDRLREEALREVFARLDVRGPQLLAVHPQANENAWLLGLVALKQEQEKHVGMVGARGVELAEPTSSGTGTGAVVECLPSDAHGGGRSGPAGVEREVRDRLDEFLAGHAVLDRPSKVERKLVEAVPGDECGYRHETPITLRQSGPLPDLAEQHALRVLVEGRGDVGE
jgi:hypothetical protein